MSRPVNRGFTLVEMLVVIGIIAILAALLLPAINMAVRAARNASISFEVNALASAIETYKNDKGDYPPNFRDPSVVLRHIRKCYPKADPNYIAEFVTRATTNSATAPNLFIDEGESLVFWLSMTDTNPTYPFLSYYNHTARPNVTSPLVPAPKKFYEFDETRLATVNPAEVFVGTNAVGTTNDVRAHIAKFSKETCYVYLESRSYGTMLGTPAAYAEDLSVSYTRPYWSETVADATSTVPATRTKAVNPTTFQVICAGQDADFGDLIALLKYYPSGENYQDGDKDNITNFSDGRMLGDKVP